MDINDTEVVLKGDDEEEERDEEDGSKGTCRWRPWAAGAEY